MTEKVYTIFKMYKCKITENWCCNTNVQPISKCKAPECEKCGIYKQHKRNMEEFDG